MGWIGRLAWASDFSKKRCRSLFWRTRAAVKKVLKNGGKQRLKFQYDPWSYALNFDDGCGNSRERISVSQKTKPQDQLAAAKFPGVSWVTASLSFFLATLVVF